MTAADLDAAWRALAEKAVKGRYDALVGRTDDGIAIEPLYPRQGGDRPRPWRQRENWSISQRIDHPDASVANQLALLDLDGGADALTLVGVGSAFSRGFGLDASREALDAALADVQLDLISVRLDAGGDTLAAATALADLAVDRRLTSAGLDIDLGFDPIGLSVRTGARWDTANLSALRDATRRGGFAGRALLADGRPYHEAGAGEAQELAAVIATGIAYVRHLEASGIDLASARDDIAIQLAVDADVFLGLAKMRAIRRLWARVEHACGLDPKPLRLHAETSWRAMTRYDPWMNVMRASAGVTGAGLGGADAITVLPMTLPLGLPDDWTRRIARNTCRVLIDEANLAKVDDAAAGSGGMEALTDGLCETAWTLVQEIERRGGIEAALASGHMQATIAETAARRTVAFATLERTIVGTSHYPSLAGGKIATLATPRRPLSHPLAGTLPSTRHADPFEALRDKVEARAAVAERPSIFLATLGAPASYGARATYAINVFAAAGIAATAETETRDPSALVAHFIAGGGEIACLCGTDADYAEQGEAVITALRKAGATLVLMVGDDQSWRKKGIGALVQNGETILQVLASAVELLLAER